MKNPAGRNLPLPGFTLIEVLLATALAAVLLSVLWTLLSMHLKLFETGQTKTEQSQLARTLLKEMSDDLHSVVQAPPSLPPVTIAAGLPMVAVPAASSAPAPKGAAGSAPPAGAASTTSPPPSVAASSAPASSSSSTAAPSSPGAVNSAAGFPSNRSAGRDGPHSVATTSSLRPAGLFGTETRLQLDIRQSTIVRDEDELDTRRRGADAPSRAADLRTVVYSFEEGRDPNHPLSEPQMALVRREVDWEQAHPATRASRRQDRASRVGAMSGAAGAPISLAPRPDGVPDDLTEVAPEVVQFGMRYFDGSQWSTEWDSVARKGLPLAIEVAMQLRVFDEPESTHHLGSESPHEDANVKQPRLPTYRLLIHIPSAVRPTIAGRGLRGDSGIRGAKPPLGADSHGSRR